MPLRLSAMKHSTSDPNLKHRGSFRSQRRQTEVSFRDDPISIPQCVLRMPSDDEEGSEHSLNLLSANESIPSTSPLGDRVPSECINRSPSVLRSAVRIMSVKRKGSLTSLQSDGKKHVLLHNVGRTIQRTGSQLRKTRLFHFFYLFVLPFYTLVGALIFQALDGEHDDRLVQEYNDRCQLGRTAELASIKTHCTDNRSCFEEMLQYMLKVENCYREWHSHNRTVTHSMSDFTNALVYAFSVYTTIGYGNMAADTMRCRLATILYGALGIPLFFAFVKEEGNLFRNLFINVYNKVRRARNKCRFAAYGHHKSPASDVTISEKVSPAASYQNGDAKHMLGIPLSPNISLPSPSPLSPLTPSDTSFREGSSDVEASIHNFLDNEPRLQKLQRKHSAGSLFGASGSKAWLDEQRRVFIAGVIVFVLYILSASLVMSLTTEFDYFTSVYFLFNSVALIGFGDVFPRDPQTILIYAVFMVLGVVLFSMCYFILQEEIRSKAFEASRKARISISKYSHTIVQHARSPWSRRNSPLYDGTGENGSFERLKKRRQSAPAVAITAPTGKTKFREI